MRLAQTLPALFAIFGLALTGCDAKTGESDPGATSSVEKPAQATAPTKAVVEKHAKESRECDDCKKAKKYHYSPFYVSIPAGKHYHTITFKDVGLIRDDKSPEAAVLEVIAESISQELQNGDLGYSTEVGYDLELTDPSNHLACGSRHVYVDVWNRGTDTYGYSLWSGCGEDDNFAWKEVKVSVNDDSALYDQVAPLAKSIHESLRAAEETQCFTKHC